MKSLIVLLFIITGFTAGATTYYFSQAGNDANNGTSVTTPWQSIAKFNAVFSAKSPGDNFLFKKGDVFYGGFVISRSGASGAPITIGAYGVGANPVITGFKTVDAWTSSGNNIWESTNAVSALSTCNIVVIEGVNYPMGRFPNSGYLVYQTFNGKISITSSSLNAATTNWTGAEVVIRKTAWITDRNPITAHSGGTLTYTSGSTNNGNANWGFFIQNDKRTLDLQNEWYYNASTKKIQIYSTHTPTGVRVSATDTLVKVQNRSYITFDGVDFTGSNNDAFAISADHIIIQNCNIDFSGKDAVWGGQNIYPSSGFVFQNNTVNHTNGNAINLRDFFKGALIQNNLIKNTGVQDGMINRVVDGNSNGVGILARADNMLVQYNEIDSSGYAGIELYNKNDIIQYNLVNYCLLTRADGGGIYQWVGVRNKPRTGQKILHNIVLNAIGNNEGTTNTGLPQAQGIYMDDWTGNVEIAYNTSANCAFSGLFLHNTTNMDIHHNTFYNNGIGTEFNSSDAVNPIRGTILKNNIFISKTAAQCVAYFDSKAADITSFGTASTMDSNYWARPIDDNVTFRTLQVLTNGTHPLSGWNASFGYDAHSFKSPKTITNVDDLRFEYNASQVSKTITLDGNYIDIKNVSYKGTITLAPYTSAVLIKNGGTNLAPLAKAGNDKTITLPVNTTGLSGSGSDTDGTISSYSWTKISGPAAGSITNPSSAAASVSAMVQGIYKFQLKVTDNAGSTGLDTMQVTVNKAGNVVPTAMAGADQAITLPASAVTLSGNGTDTDGTITTYSWTQISGPSAGVINNSSAASTMVTSLVQGTYQFQLKITDNDAAYGFDTIQIVIHPEGSTLLPAVNPGNCVNGLDYKYFESGSGWTVLPDFSALSPVKTGIAGDFDISLANRAITFSFSFSGFIYVPSDGQYTFYTTSDDGSNLFIDNVLVVNNDGRHGTMEKSGTIGLEAGKHAISVGYFQQGGGDILDVNYSGPGILKQAVPASSLYRISTQAGRGAVSMDAPGTDKGMISSNQVEIKAYPNPFTSYIEVNINGGAAGSYKLLLIDVSGNVIWSAAGVKSAGAYKQSVNTSGLLRGTYFMKVIQNNTCTVIKVVK